MANSNSETEWDLLRSFLKTRWKDPFKSIGFILYFFVVIVLIGILTSFLGLFETIDFKATIDYQSISIALISYGLVLLYSSAIELIFIKLKNDEQRYRSIKNSISMIGISTILMGLILALITYFVPYDIVKVICCVIICLSGLYLWWITNSKSLSLLNESEHPSTDITTGGNPTSTNLSGDIPQDYIV